MTNATLLLIERVSQRLDAVPGFRGVPATEDDIAAAEAQLGCTFPPSYRAFAQKVGGLSLPPHLGVVHRFVGVHGCDLASHPDVPPEMLAGVVAQTLAARTTHLLGPHLIVVGLGAEYQEWFCLDTRHTQDGEAPIRLFDARDRALDGEFYADFGTMIHEVLGFVDEALDVPRN